MIAPLKATFLEGKPNTFSEFKQNQDVLPVEYGGTGTSSISELRKALGILINSPLEAITIDTVQHTYDKTTDISTRIYMDNNNDNDVIIPLDTGLFNIGDWFEVSKVKVSKTHILGAEGVTVKSIDGYNQVEGVYGVVRCTYYGENTWHLTGDLAPGLYYATKIDLSQVFTVGIPVSGTGVINPAGGFDFYSTTSVEGSAAPIFVPGDKEIVLPGVSGTYIGLALTKFGTLSASEQAIGFEVSGYFENDALTEKSFGIGFIAPTAGEYNTLTTAAGFGIHLKAGSVTANTAVVYNNASTVNVGWADCEFLQKFTLRLERASNGLVTIYVNGIKARQVFTSFSYATSNPLVPVLYGLNSRVHITGIRLMNVE